MRYITRDNVDRANRVARRTLTDFPNIDRTGSVRGMQSIYNWPRGGQVRIGGYIYNIGPDLVKRLIDAGLVRT